MKYLSSRLLVYLFIKIIYLKVIFIFYNCINKCVYAYVLTFSYRFIFIFESRLYGPFLCIIIISIFKCLNETHCIRKKSALSVHRVYCPGTGH